MSDSDGRDQPTPGRLAAIAVLVMVAAAAIGAVWTSVDATLTQREIAYQQARERCQGATNSDCQQLATAIRSAVADERAADFAAQQLWLNILGILGLGATVVFAAFAWLESQKGVKAALMEYSSTHRPKIKVRQFFLVPSGDNITIQFMLVNIGNTEATLIERNHAIIYSPFKNSIGALGTDKPPVYESIRIAPGQFLYTTLVDIVVDTPQGKKHAADVRSGKLPLFVMGYVTYVDKTGAFRRSGYLREFDPTTRRFRVVNDAEYEYMD